MSRYMTAYQLGHIAIAWDPIFGDGKVHVLTSTLSKSLPISDAGLGAFTYLVELLSGFMGDPRRWRTMPWMVALFGFMVVPLGIVSVGLIMLQPVMVGAWCTFCQRLSCARALRRIDFRPILSRAVRGVRRCRWQLEWPEHHDPAVLAA